MLLLHLGYFSERITEEQAPDYSKIIAEPMDLTQMRARLYRALDNRHYRRKRPPSIAALPAATEGGAKGPKKKKRSSGLGSGKRNNGKRNVRGKTAIATRITTLETLNMYKTVYDLLRLVLSHSLQLP